MSGAASGLALLCTLPSPVMAQSALPAPTLAFAAVDTRTRTQQVCTAGALAAARDCAIAKCRSGGGRDCRVTAACQPAKWSGSLAVALQGSRFSLTICGVPSRPGLIVRLKDMCRDYRSRGLEACTLESVWTPTGEEETAGLRWTRQALRPLRASGR